MGSVGLGAVGGSGGDLDPVGLEFEEFFEVIVGTVEILHERKRRCAMNQGLGWRKGVRRGDGLSCLTSRKLNTKRGQVIELVSLNIK